MSDSRLLDSSLEPKEIYAASRTRFPTPMAPEASFGDKASQIAYIAERFRQIMLCLGLDLEDPSLAKTPERVAKMYVEELFIGLDPESFPSITLLDNRYHHSQQGNLVFVTSRFHSVCEHHFLPMVGTAYVGYVANEQIIGLSKIPRLVDHFARRPQLQERLTAQIADSLSYLLDTEQVAVSISATHFCVIARGIQEESSQTTSCVLRGAFERDPLLRSQFFESISRYHATSQRSYGS